MFFSSCHNCEKLNLAGCDAPCCKLVEIAIALFVGASVDVEVHAYALPDIEVERLRKVVTECNACGTWVLLVRFEDDVAGGNLDIVL